MMYFDEAKRNGEDVIPSCSEAKERSFGSILRNAMKYLQQVLRML
jgi:predicted GNAT family acetyltransferase